MEPPASTSSSERSLVSFPGVPPAGWLALVVALCGGVGLRAVASPAPWVPPLAMFSGLDATAYRYDATTRRAPPGGSEILLVGSSLMRYAVREEQLAEELGDRDLIVFNAALDGGRLWEVLRLVDALPPSRATRRLAVLEVNRVSAETALLPHPYADARRWRDGLPPHQSLREAAALVWEQVPPRQDAVSWGTQAIYGSLAPRVPGLVPVPAPIPRLLWSLTDAQRERAVRGKEPEEMGANLHHSVWATTRALTLIVAALKDHGYRVLVLQTPLHGQMIEAMSRSPISAASERAYRSFVLDPAANGADAALVFDRTADLGGDDTMLADYGHLLPAGSTALTHLLADYLRRSPIWSLSAG
jgi:hypothetical protein